MTTILLVELVLTAFPKNAAADLSTCLVWPYAGTFQREQRLVYWLLRIQYVWRTKTPIMLSSPHSRQEKTSPSPSRDSLHIIPTKSHVSLSLSYTKNPAYPTFFLFDCPQTLEKKSMHHI